MKAKYTIGFDLGGTKMMAAVIAQDNKVLSRVKQKSNSQEGSDALYALICETIKMAIQEADINKDDIGGIGVAVPGQIDFKKGIILNTPNLPFSGFALQKKLEKDFSIPVLLENDVNAGTWGEFKLGAGRGHQHVIGLFPGTGIGGGLVLNGQLYRGATGNAGEVGHMIIQLSGPLCGCGQRGCLEALASKTALSKEAVALAASGKAPQTYEKAGTDFKKFKSSVFGKALENKEEAVVDTIIHGAKMLGIGMANLVNIFSPEMIILGGGLTEKLSSFYIKETERSMIKHALPALVKHVVVREAELGDDAVFLGAALLDFEE